MRMKYRVKYLSTFSKHWLTGEETSSYNAFRAAVRSIETGNAIECIVYVFDDENTGWVKVANVRK